jgi:uncharacterized protein (DUF2252 family)
MKQSLLEHFHSKQESIEERIDKGKALRKKIPRLLHADYKPSSDRIDPISILEKQAVTRLPDLVPIRHARMLTSPFAFLRGAAGIMAGDLAAGVNTGITVQACGDMHVANFGVFASAERKLIFGINDFDETLPGPWEWDLKRLATSVVTVGKYLGADNQLCEEAVMATVRSYREHIRKYALKGNLELRYATIGENDILDALSASAREGAIKIFNKARGSTHMQVLGKLTDLVDDQYRLRVNAPFIVRETHTQVGRPINEALGMFLDSYFDSLADDRKYLLMHYRIVDAARKIVGVGSVGTRCWIIFLTGNDEDDPFFLQLKEAQPSVLEPYLSKSIYESQGRRVVEGQRLIQGAPDIFLGWGEIDGLHFYVRQLRDMKGGVDFDPEKVKVKNIPQYGALCGWALALAHAKSGDAALLSGYMGNSDELDEAITKYAFAYDEQNETDYTVFKEAVSSGRLKASIAEAQ